LNTRILMTASAGILGLAGLVAVFAPELPLAALGGAQANFPAVVVQLLGTLYLAFAFMNWLARGSAIGGPSVLVVVVAGIYAVFAILFWWLAFKHTGLVDGASRGRQAP